MPLGWHTPQRPRRIAGLSSLPQSGLAARLRCGPRTDVRPRFGGSITARKSILIVEDDEDARFVLGAILNHGGYRVLEARDGDEGVALAARHAPDLIILDVHTSRGEGLQAGAAIRSDDRTRNIPVLAVTERRFVGAGRSRTEALFESCLSKPVEPARLVESVHDIIGGAAPPA